MIYFVKPHPPIEIMHRKTPVPEGYKYNWEPMILKLAVYYLKQRNLPVQSEVWHLFDEKDDELFLKSVKENQPAFIVFTEIDILVNEISRLSKKCRELSPDTIFIVCGKQSSLLRKADHLPFRNIDYVLGGDALNSLPELIEMLINDKSSDKIPGLVKWDDNFKITGNHINEERTSLENIDGKLLREIPVLNHSFKEYLTDQQKHPAVIKGEIKTAPVFIGTGCPYQCSVCQSPIEYGDESRTLCFREPESLAEELAWLVKQYGVNNVFSLEPNFNLVNLEKIYSSLENHGIDNLAFSGFIRAADVTRAAENGLLARLVPKGLRVLSIGLDIPVDSRDDVYNKQFSYDDMIACLDICAESGILVFATLVGDPELTEEQFENILERIKVLPVTGVDIRLAMALRNTAYFEKVEDYLVIHPEKNSLYFDRQNYRYQTIQYPGKINPEQTYNLVSSFHRDFFISVRHIEYAAKMTERFPDTRVFFRKQYLFYKDRTDSVPEIKNFLETLYKD